MAWPVLPAPPAYPGTSGTATSPAAAAIAPDGLTAAGSVRTRAVLIG